MAMFNKKLNRIFTEDINISKGGGGGGGTQESATVKVDGEIDHTLDFKLPTIDMTGVITYKEKIEHSGEIIMPEGTTFGGKYTIASTLFTTTKSGGDMTLFSMMTDDESSYIELRSIGADGALEIAIKEDVLTDEFVVSTSNKKLYMVNTIVISGCDSPSWGGNLITFSFEEYGSISADIPASMLTKEFHKIKYYEGFENCNIIPYGLLVASEMLSYKNIKDLYNAAMEEKGIETVVIDGEEYNVGLFHRDYDILYVDTKYFSFVADGGYNKQFRSINSAIEYMKKNDLTGDKAPRLFVDCHGGEMSPEDYNVTISSDLDIKSLYLKDFYINTSTGGGSSINVSGLPNIEICGNVDLPSISVSNTTTTTIECGRAVSRLSANNTTLILDCSSVWQSLSLDNIVSASYAGHTSTIDARCVSYLDLKGVYDANIVADITHVKDMRMADGNTLDSYFRVGSKIGKDIVGFGS